MSNPDMTGAQFDQLLQSIEGMETRLESRIDGVEKRMITKADVFQSVLTVQAFFAATIVGCVVVLNALGALS